MFMVDGDVCCSVQPSVHRVSVTVRGTKATRLMAKRDVREDRPSPQKPRACKIQQVLHTFLMLQCQIEKHVYDESGEKPFSLALQYYSVKCLVLTTPHSCIQQMYFKCIFARRHKDRKKSQTSSATVRVAGMQELSVMK